ncbi:uncharacterized protein LOC131663852 isoform X1 [Phymastichus coffea]|uniref:uncharacterized protein LOC131663852 isoform X1 n=1 Tax=Phymastichus coffea TaxID=108790 RepID=UPI00273A858C|nr:uncharacterized protein LOC131663852 isoform X1 [Phymastichus coffea]
MACRLGRLLLLVFFTLSSIAGIEALRMTALKIPRHVVQNQTIRMECNFNLDRETLYSVKWYKDGHEFYRYVPKEHPSVYVFALPGVNVDKASSTERSVVLNRVNHNSTGRYRCEVSAEAPFFHTVSNHADMGVVVLPERGPTISGVKSKYHVGDTVRANCTSAPSKPPAQLMWYVNEETVEAKYLHGPRKLSVDSNNLVTIQLSLEFQARSRHFRDGDMRLKCLATISALYQSSDEHRVLGDERFLKQPMESRETRAQSHTRNELSRGIQARSATSATILSTLSIFAVSHLRR